MRRTRTITVRADRLHGARTKEGVATSDQSLHDLPFAMIYTESPDADALMLVCSTGIDRAHPAAPAILLRMLSSRHTRCAGSGSSFDAFTGAGRC
jgi:hypothetical protein